MTQEVWHRNAQREVAAGLIDPSLAELGSSLLVTCERGDPTAFVIDALRRAQSPARLRSVAALLSDLLDASGRPWLANRVRLWARLRLDGSTESRLGYGDQWDAQRSMFDALAGKIRTRIRHDYRDTLRRYRHQLLDLVCVECGTEYQLSRCRHSNRPASAGLCEGCRERKRQSKLCHKLPEGLSMGAYRERIKRYGWDPVRAATEPPAARAPRTPTELRRMAKEHGVSAQTLRKRLKKGMDPHLAATQPPLCYWKNE
jgi:hypothetical protein